MVEKSNSEKKTTLIHQNIPKTTQFGHYQIIGELGRGGMGQVLKAWDTRLKRTIALKVLIPHNQDIESAIKRFSIEAMSVAKLSHPNIVRLYEIGVDHGYRYFTMDYIQGKTLHEAGVERKLSIRKVVPLMIKIALAIHYAHTQNIIHRDLKPGNIIVDEKGEPFIMDFGLAKMTDTDKSMTQTGIVMGTPFYMSPEQASGNNKNVGEKSDVYSLGVILYELLTGKVPFSAPSSMEILKQIIEEEPSSIRAVNPKIPKPLESICFQAMNKQVKRRYNTAKEFADDLERFTKNEKVHARTYYNKKVKRGMLISFTSIIFLVLGYLLGLQNNPSEAKQDFYVNIDKMSLSEQLHYAERLINQEFFQNAYDILIKSLQQLNLVSVEKDIVYGQLVITTSHLKKYDETLFFYQKLEAPKNEVKLAVAKTYYYLEDYEKSKNIFLEIEQDDKVAVDIKLETFMFKGLIAYYYNNYQDAIEELKKVENILLDGSVSGLANSYKTTVFLHLGNSYLADENYALAQHYLEKAQKFLPDLSAIYEGLGKCCLATNLAVEARNYFEKCISLEPENSFYYSYLGQALENLEKYEEANNMYLKALELDSSSFEGMRGLLTIPLKEVGVMEGNVEYILFYVNQARRVAVPDLLSSYMQQLVHNYHSNYLMWMEMNKKQEVSPENFLLRLTSEDILPEVYESVQKALLTLRYYPQIEELVNDVIQKSKDKARLRILQTWEMIKKVKDQEQKFLTYYYMAKLYLKEEVSIPEDNIKIAYNILDDTNENVIHRYLAAKTILENLDFETIEENAASKNQESFLPLICNTVLQEAGFPAKYPYYYFKEIWKKDTFLSLLVAKNMGEDLKMWEYFRESSNPLILLLAAANLGQAKYAGIENVKEARKTLARFTEDTQKDYVKVYAHYYLWKSYHIHKDKIAHEKIFIKGLHGNNTEIKKNILTYQSMFETPEQWEDIANIMRNSNDPGVVHLAMTNLATHNIEHPVFNELIYGQKYVYSTRTMSFITRFFYIPASTPDERKVKIAQNLNLMFRELPKLKQDKAPQFRYVIYFLLAMTGFHSLDSLESEQDISVKAHIIINTRFKMMGRFKSSNEYELKLIEPYLKSSHKEIFKAAIAAFMALSSDEEREKMFQSVMEQQDKSAMEGAAIGYYTLVKVPFLRTVNWQGTTNMFDKEEHYQSYIDLYTKFLDHEPLRKDCYRWLSNAIQLYPRAWYYYERSLIHILEKKYPEAIHDIQEALKLVPDSIRYTCTLAEVYYLQNNTAAAKACLHKLHSFKSVYHLLIMGDIYLKIGSYKDARNIFAKICLLFPRKKDYLLRLAKCYDELGNEKYKNKYIDYAKAFLKKR